MKRIVKLTERDLASIVKRVINEQQTIGLAGIKGDSVKDVVTSLNKGEYVDPSTPQKCSDLNYKVTDEWAFHVKRHNYARNKEKGDTQDPYGYVELKNGTYCVTKSMEYGGGDSTWTTVTDPKMVEIIKKVLEKK